MIAPLPPDLLADAQALRQALYEGAVLIAPPGPASRALCAQVNHLLTEAFPGLPPRRAHAHLSTEEVLTRVGQVRQLLRAPRFTAAARAVMAECGLDPGASAVDVVRLRAVLPGGHHSPAAAPAYALHRDTWYGNPQAQINLWLPLHDVAAGQALFFLPDWFARPVPNDSHRFDYDAWIERVGWQRQHRPPDAAYPTVQADLSDARRAAVACPEAAAVLFAAAHLHGTSTLEDTATPVVGESAGWIRFSLDFRAVHLPDHAAGRGAPDVDQRCRGSALKDYQAP